jgi:subtilisin family serine protease
MSIAAAHQWSQGEGVTVAVIDTGVDVSHPDLAGRTRIARNYVGDRAPAPVAERHGTAIAGIIAAVGNNGEGIVGVAPRVSLLSLRACWSADPAATVGTCNTFTLARALSAAIEARADVINLSLVGPSDPLLAALVTHAIERGAIVAGAVPAGGRIRGFPSEVPGVLPVDMAEQDRPAPTTLRAPGREVLTLAPQGHYDFVTGSSFATASVSGAVALMRARRPRLTSGDVRELLQRSMQASLGSLEPIEAIDACSALSALLTAGRCPQAAESGTASLTPPVSGTHVVR